MGTPSFFGRPAQLPETWRGGNLVLVLLLVQSTLNEMMEAHGADWSATLQRTGVLSVGVAHVMSRARLRELVVLFAIGSALTVAVFFLALWLLPFERFTRFPLPRFPALFN